MLRNIILFIALYCVIDAEAKKHPFRSKQKLHRSSSRNSQRSATDRHYSIFQRPSNYLENAPRRRRTKFDLEKDHTYQRDRPERTTHRYNGETRYARHGGLYTPTRGTFNQVCYAPGNDSKNEDEHFAPMQSHLFRSGSNDLLAVPTVDDMREERGLPRLHDDSYDESGIHFDYSDDVLYPKSRFV